jgi:hypothetical protein
VDRVIDGPMPDLFGAEARALFGGRSNGRPGTGGPVTRAAVVRLRVGCADACCVVGPGAEPVEPLPRRCSLTPPSDLDPGAGTRPGVPSPAAARPPLLVVARRLLVLVVLALGLAIAFDGRAALPEVPDPQAWALLTPQEQAARRAEIATRLQQATPAERQAFRRALRERLESLTPEQRQALAGQARQRWNELPAEERERLQRERRERLQAMTPEERRQLLQQRRAMLDRLTPEERAALREPLQAR